MLYRMIHTKFVYPFKDGRLGGHPCNSLVGYYDTNEHRVLTAGGWTEEERWRCPGCHAWLAGETDHLALTEAVSYLRAVAELARANGTVG